VGLRIGIAFPKTAQDKIESARAAADRFWPEVRSSWLITGARSEQTDCDDYTILRARLEIDDERLVLEQWLVPAHERLDARHRPRL
jgi:hypothetical protein